MWLWSILSGCVVSVDQRLVIDEPVDRIEVSLASGDISVEGTRGQGPVTLEGVLAGPSDGTTFPEVVDGVLRVVVDCDACAGSLTIRAPANTELDLVASAGAVTVSGMDAAIRADVTLGDVDVYDHGSGLVRVLVDLGSAELRRTGVGEVVVDVKGGDAVIEVPPGAWNLDLDAGLSEPVVGPSITDDPEGTLLHAHVRRGQLTVR